MKPELYWYELRVPPSAIDQRNHVNNLKYLEWCMEAAHQHWQRNASEDMVQNYIWYVLHHSIDYRAAAFEGELLRVETWVVSSEGVRSERRYRIIRVDDQQKLIEAKTIWCLLSAKSQKPVKIPDELRTLF